MSQYEALSFVPLPRAKSKTENVDLAVVGAVELREANRGFSTPRLYAAL